VQLQGLPDFQKPIISEGFQIFYPYEGAGKHVFMPDGLKLAERTDGSPDFMLEFVRGLNPTLPPMPHGILDFRVMPTYRTDQALGILREMHPGAMVEPAFISSGKLVIQTLGKGSLPDDIKAPIQMAWNGLGVARSFLKISVDTATIIKKSLESDILSLQAYAELEMSGVSPRVPVKVKFNPGTLLEALASLGDEKRIVQLSKVLEFFMKDPQSIPVEISGDFGSIDRRGFSEAITDRLVDRFCSFTLPLEEGFMEPYISLPAKGQEVSGTFEWDLFEPLEVVRAFILNLAPLETISNWTKDHMLDGIYREVVVPAIQTGFLPVSISANLPAQIVGVLMIGVRIKAPPNPPYRPQEISEFSELNPQKDSARVVLRFSPAERPEYIVQTFVVIKDSSRLRELRGPETIHKDDYIELSPVDFPIDFAIVGASKKILKLSALRGSGKWSTLGTTVGQPFDLSIDRPSAAIAVPKDTDEVLLEVEAFPIDGSRSLKLGPVKTKILKVETCSFPEYGPHKITIECIFGVEVNLFAIDLLPESAPEAEANVLHFTLSKPKREWNWVTDSPFHSGYRYREHRNPDQVQAVWSEIKSAFEDLVIKVKSGDTDNQEV
jgi:hypothetical protein